MSDSSESGTPYAHLSDRASATWFPNSDPPVVEVSVDPDDAAMPFTVYVTPDELQKLNDFAEREVFGGD